ncbi:MAG: DUF2029 domain-containing protein [Candidatus Binatia bacterium]|nr:DUF2029 domain-containing protein [Candidatus Binatia bacterium]
MTRQHGEEPPSIVRRWCAKVAESAAAQVWVRRAIVVYVLAVFIVRIHHEGDFAGYLRAGELVLAGQDPYRSTGVNNTWPPFFSVLCVPLAVLARPTAYLARCVWFVLNFTALWWVAAMSAELVYGRRMTWRDPWGLSISSPWVLVPLLLSERYVSSNFDHVQINILLFALVLSGLKMQAEGRWLWGGSLIGLAAAIKLLPLTFLGYFAWRRRWKVFFSTAGTFVALSLSPMLIWGWSRFWDYFAGWRERVESGWGVGRLNQSVWAMWDRWLGHGMVPLVTPGAHDIPSSGSPWVPVAVAGTLLVFAGALWWRACRTAPTSWQSLCEWSLVFVGTALFSPVTWKAYLAVSLLPNMLLFAAWWNAAPSSVLGRAAATGLIASAVTNLLSPGILGRNLAARLEMACVPTLVGLALLAALICAYPYLVPPSGEAPQSAAQTRPGGAARG